MSSSGQLKAVDNPYSDGSRVQNVTSPIHPNGVVRVGSKGQN